MTLKHFSGEEHFEPAGAPCTCSSMSFYLEKDHFFLFDLFVDWMFCQWWDGHRLSTGWFLCCDDVSLCRSGRNQHLFNRRWSTQLWCWEVLRVGSSWWKKESSPRDETGGKRGVDSFSQTIVCLFSPETEGFISPAALPQHICCSKCCAMTSSAFREAWGCCRDCRDLISCPWTRLQPAVLIAGSLHLLFTLGAPSSALGRKVKRRGVNKKQLLALQSCSFWSLQPAVWFHSCLHCKDWAFPNSLTQVIRINLPLAL